MKRDWKKENCLDEMQEQKLLHIEKNSFWLLYWALVAAILGQVLLGAEVKEVAAELICFMGVSIFMVVQCARNGIWDRHFKPDRRTNLLLSIVAGGVVALLQPLSYWMHPEEWHSLTGLMIAMVFCGFFTFLVTFFLMTAAAGAARRRREALERGGEEENE